MINVSIEKKDMLIISAVLVLLVGAGLAIAWNSANPAVHGHTANEIEGAGIKILANNAPYTQTVNIPAKTCRIIVVDANLKGKRSSDGDGTDSLTMLITLNGIDLTTEKLHLEGTRSAGIAPEWNYGGTTSRRIYIEKTDIDQEIGARIINDKYTGVEANYSVICH